MVNLYTIAIGVILFLILATVFSSPPPPPRPMLVQLVQPPRPPEASSGVAPLIIMLALTIFALAYFQA